MIRMLCAACAAAAAAVVATSAVAEERDTWFVTTRMPVLARGVRAVACLGPIDDLGTITVWRGRCPGGVEPVVGLVIAIPGDQVDVIPGAGLQVNGSLIPGTLPLDRDSRGRPMPVFPTGRYDLQVSQYWIRGSDPDSFDSRYFGPVVEQEIVSTAVPGYALAKPRRQYRAVEQ
jgi:type IV secretory pathway protease TraF